MISLPHFTSTSISRVSVLGVLSKALKAHRVNKGPKAELWQALSSLPSQAYGPGHLYVSLDARATSSGPELTPGHFLLLILDLPSQAATLFA